MGDPVLHLLAGPNGAGKSTFYLEVLGPATGLRWINADDMAAANWPGSEMEHAYEASALAAEERRRALAARLSFISETVFSHESKTALVRDARAAGYRVTLQVFLIPEELAVARVANRVAYGGHAVPEDKIRSRYSRLWAHIAESIGDADETNVYDNSRAVCPFRRVAVFRAGLLVGSAEWPSWTPPALRGAGPAPT